MSPERGPANKAISFVVPHENNTKKALWQAFSTTKPQANHNRN
jgi:hypothetical protein